MSSIRVSIEIAMLGGLFVCGACSNVIRVNSTNMIGERISARLRQNVYGSILRQDMMFFDKTRTGELVNRLSSGKVINFTCSRSLAFE